MKVFLDTNVLASALATRGLCADVLREVLSNENLVVSQEVLDELKDVLCRKFGLPISGAAEAVAFVRIDSVFAKPTAPINVNISDADDIPILSAAIAAHADVFVTGDKLLLGLRRIGKMVIIGPRGFWEMLQNRREV
jgi:putative PIN family toxin of toxin-antitoxin system